MYADTAALLKARAIFLSEKEKAAGIVEDKHKYHVAKVWLREWIDLVACSAPNGKKLEEKQVNTMYKKEIYDVSFSM
jgi:hypothetical protein